MVIMVFDNTDGYLQCNNGENSACNFDNAKNITFTGNTCKCSLRTTDKCG